MRSNVRSSSADAPLFGAALVFADLLKGTASGIGVASPNGGSRQRPSSPGGFNQRAALTSRRLSTGNVELKYIMSGSRQEAQNFTQARLGNWGDVSDPAQRRLFRILTFHKKFGPVQLRQLQQNLVKTASERCAVKVTRCRVGPGNFTPSLSQIRT